MDCSMNIKNDLIVDTLGINSLTSNEKNWEKRIADYYKYYHNDQWSISQLVDSCQNTGFGFFNYMPINITYNDMLSSGNTSLLNENLRNKLAMLKKEQDLLYIITEHLIADTKTNVHEVEKYWNMENSHYFKTSVAKRTINLEFGSEEDKIYNDKDLLIGLKFHHNIFNWMRKSFYFHKVRGQSIKGQSLSIIKEINNELEK